MYDTLFESDGWRLYVQWDQGCAFLHCHVSKWSPSTLREMKKEWPLVLEAFRVSGVNTVYSYVPRYNDKINSWQKMWGMEEVMKTDDAILYEKSTGVNDGH